MERVRGYPHVRVFVAVLRKVYERVIKNSITIYTDIETVLPELNKELVKLGYSELTVEQAVRYLVECVKNGYSVVLADWPPNGPHAFYFAEYANKW